MRGRRISLRREPQDKGPVGRSLARPVIVRLSLLSSSLSVVEENR
jgi:hypothetical protein